MQRKKRDLAKVEGSKKKEEKERGWPALVQPEPFFVQAFPSVMHLSLLFRWLTIFVTLVQAS